MSLWRFADFCYRFSIIQKVQNDVTCQNEQIRSKYKLNFNFKSYAQPYIILYIIESPIKKTVAIMAIISMHTNAIMSVLALVNGFFFE